MSSFKKLVSLLPLVLLLVGELVVATPVEPPRGPVCILLPSSPISSDSSFLYQSPVKGGVNKPDSQNKVVSFVRIASPPRSPHLTQVPLSECSRRRCHQARR